MCGEPGWVEVWGVKFWPGLALYGTMGGMVWLVWFHRYKARRDMEMEEYV